MSLFGKGLSLGSLGRRRGVSVLGKVGMLLGLGCARPSGEVGTSSIKGLLLVWAMVEGCEILERCSMRWINSMGVFPLFIFHILDKGCLGDKYLGPTGQGTALKSSFFKEFEWLGVGKD